MTEQRLLELLDNYEQLLNSELEESSRSFRKKKIKYCLNALQEIREQLSEVASEDLIIQRRLSFVMGFLFSCGLVGKEDFEELCENRVAFL